MNKNFKETSFSKEEWMKLQESIVVELYETQEYLNYTIENFLEIKREFFDDESFNYPNTDEILLTLTNAKNQLDKISEMLPCKVINCVETEEYVIIE